MIIDSQVHAEHPRDCRARLCARHLPFRLPYQGSLRSVPQGLRRPRPPGARGRSLLLSRHRRHRAGCKGSDAPRRLDLRTSGRVAEPFSTPPGYFSLADATKIVKARGKRGVTARDGKFVDTHHGAIEDLVKAGIMFVGTPDEVTSQITDFVESIGGLGHLLLMGHAGHLSHADAMNQITLLAKDVLPRVQRPTASKRAA
jgi:hypothetical protein